MYFRSRMSRNGTAVAVPAAARLHRVPGSAASSRVVISNKRSSNTRPASRTARRPRWPNWSASNCWCRVLSRHWDLKICKRSPRRCSNNTKRCSNTCSSWPCFNRRIRRPQASFRHRRSSFYRIKWVYGVENSSLSVITYPTTIPLNYLPTRYESAIRTVAISSAGSKTIGADRRSSDARPCYLIGRRSGESGDVLFFADGTLAIRHRDSRLATAQKRPGMLPPRLGSPT